MHFLPIDNCIARIVRIRNPSMAIFYCHFCPTTLLGHHVTKPSCKISSDKHKYLVAGFYKVVTELLDGGGGIPCKHILAVVCDQNGLCSLDNDDSLLALIIKSAMVFRNEANSQEKIGRKMMWRMINRTFRP